MSSLFSALFLAVWILNSAVLANAGIFVLQPAAGTLCHANQKCVIEWLDDGIKPLLSAVGVCTFGLYIGKQKLVQVIPPADVSVTRSVSFKPNPAAGANSDAYYIGITSTNAKDNSSLPYIAFSPFFRIDQMTGSFDNPLPEATSTISIPSSLTRPTTGTATSTKLSTITVGTLSTSQPPLPSFTISTSKSRNPASSSSPSTSPTKLTTSTVSSSSTTARTGASSPTSTPPSNNASRYSTSTPVIRTIIPILLLSSLFLF